MLACQRESGLGVIEAGRLPCARGMASFTGLRETALHVVRIRRALEILQVTRDARGLRDVVIVVDVAIHASPRRHGVLAGQREPGLRVVELRWLPGAGGVAGLAGLRESLLYMVRIRRVLEILQVARDARRLGDVVVVVHVTIDAGAWRHGVLARQRESGLSVIEVGWLPRAGGVAGLARLREASLYVVRIRRALEILEVTRDAGCLRDVVVVIDVAIGTGPRRYRVLPGKRELRLTVIELRRLPGVGAVAELAALGKALLHVVRIRRALEVLQVARHARGLRDVVVVIDVAIGASPRRHGVLAGKWESGFRVIELGRLPGARGMTRLTSLREAALHVVRIRGALEILEMTRDARGLRDVVIVVDVAVDAGPWRHGVLSR